MKNFLFLVLVAAAVYEFWTYGNPFSETAAERSNIPAGVPAILQPPEQQMLAVPQVIQKNGYTLNEVASYRITARILSAARYHFDRESGLAPVDLALGWGPMADRRVLKKITITQSGRFYDWQTDDYPIAREQIEQDSANNHIIPADSAVDGKVKGLHAGQVIELSGYLVNITAKDGWHWNTSLTRNDTGPGACEVFYVDKVTVY